MTLRCSANRLGHCTLLVGAFDSASTRRYSSPARPARRFRTSEQRSSVDVRKWLDCRRSFAVSWIDGPVDSRRLYNALTARDSRFDGVFFVGVTSTDIYCRPICPVKTPKEANCRFFDTPQEAEQAGFRPCLRCRPELAPGNAPVDDAQRIAQLIVQRLEEGHLDEKAGLEEIADQFELSSRQIRRIVQKELGVPPIQLLLTRRLLLAKQLLTETTLPITEVAFASGFSSLRRFNDAFNRRYGMPPTRLRKKATEDARRDRRTPDVDAAALLSSAVRLEGRPRVSGGPRAHGHRARDGRARMPGPCSWERRRAGSG